MRRLGDPRLLRLACFLKVSNPDASLSCLPFVVASNCTSDHRASLLDDGLQRSLLEDGDEDPTREFSYNYKGHIFNYLVV